MLKPPPPTIPGMTDTLEFVKNLWGSMNVPGVGVPGMGGATLSTDELDKRIADLKAVESWLNMNTTMLRGTIHALEVQRGTIATLKSMSASMAQAMGQTGEQAGMANPFAQFFAQPGAGAPAGQAQPQPKAQPKSGPQDAGAGGAQGAAEAPAGAAGLPAAVAWWNLLQDQFTQAVASAMSPEAAAAAGFAGAPAKPPEESGGGSPQAGAPTPRPPKSGPGKT